MKKWTVWEARDGNAAQPTQINYELRTAASSLQTLDRSQLPAGGVDDATLATNALHQVWFYPRYPLTSGSEGEQQAVRDSTISLTNNWRCFSYQEAQGGWLNVGSPITLTGFKGGSLLVEWSGIGWQWPAFTNTQENFDPGNPKHVRLRILVGGVSFCERLGPGYHEAWRAMGCQYMPAGDHQVLLQFQPTPIGADDAVVDNLGSRLAQAHLYGSKVFIMGRYR